ncbi:unnamed protein product [Caenorhabditis auriculariae]|uniref:Uncharacterized protein n=1 Tax=Caenorhabditis auriculariae TaxID=2777116 RepID=A0A8S1H324_9PELO|nr:unnamed protein product [Caenorhabditis auriculariae]
MSSMKELGSILAIVTAKEACIVTCKFGKVVVYYNELGLNFNTFNIDDIVEVTARECEPQQIGRNTAPVKYKATKITFVRKPRVLYGTGRVIMVDENGQFGYTDLSLTESVTKNDAKSEVYFVLENLRPRCESLNKVFKTRDTINFVAIEQAPNKRNVCWKTVAVAQPGFLIEEFSNKGKTEYTAVKMGPGRNVHEAPARPVANSSNTRAELPQKPTERFRKQIEKTQKSAGSSLLSSENFMLLKAECQQRFESFVTRAKASNPNVYGKDEYIGALQINFLASMIQC